MTRKISALMLGMSLVLASSQAVAHGHHSHGPALTEAEQKASEGIFADQDVKDRTLSDWDGISLSAERRFRCRAGAEGQKSR